MNRKNFKKAYSLIELSIVILIIAILITGALSVSIGSINNAKTKTTNDRIREVYKAIGNFLITNKRLPCPASLKKIKTVDTDYGAEVGAGSACAGVGVYQSLSSGNLVYGMVPSRALGLSNDMAEDAFESKLAYIVDKNFTNTVETVPNFSNKTFATATYGGIITIDEKPSGITQVVTTDAIIAVISYGANKAGAFNSNAATQNTRSGDADEMDNDPSATFDDAPTPKTADFNSTLISSSGNSDVFDDIVFFKRRNDFVEDFKVMFLIPCNGATTTTNFLNSDSAYYGQIVYNSACISPATQSRKCEAYGTWVNITNSCV